MAIPLKTIILKPIFAFILLFLLAQYLLLIQHHFDSNTSSFTKGCLYSLLVLLSGITYDFVKTVVFMESKNFEKFTNHSIGSVVHIIISTILCFVTAYFYQVGTHTTITIAAFAYAFALGQIYYILKHIMGVIDASIK